MAKAIKAVIFDFNGTLFNDTHFHDTAWKEFASRYGKNLSPGELDKNIHGFTNREIFTYIFKRSLEENELYQFYEEKEEIYRFICQKNSAKCILTKGAEDFFNYLLEKNIPQTIATASYLPNVELYFNMFHLEHWFQRDHVIYDSGNFRGKPHPDMFLAAAEKMQVSIPDCMIIEDSEGGIQAARNAKAGVIIAACFKDNHSNFSKFDYIDRIITDFMQLTDYFN